MIADAVVTFLCAVALVCMGVRPRWVRPSRQGGLALAALLAACLVPSMASWIETASQTSWPIVLDHVFQGGPGPRDFQECRQRLQRLNRPIDDPETRILGGTCPSAGVAYSGRSPRFTCPVHGEAL